MNAFFTIEPNVVIEVKQAVSVSKPMFYLDEQREMYRATVETYDADENFLLNCEVFFTQEEYDAWGTDNDYIYSLLLTKLGMVQIVD